MSKRRRPAWVLSARAIPGSSWQGAAQRLQNNAEGFWQCFAERGAASFGQYGGGAWQVDQLGHTVSFIRPVTVTAIRMCPGTSAIRVANTKQAEQLDAKWNA